MAQFKPVRIGDTVPLQQINPDTEEINGKIYVSQSGVVLGRSTTGAGPHEEILFGDLPGGPGGASITDITYADMTTALAGATLTPGQFYRITDAAGTDLGFVCQAVRDNEITVSGTGGYLNADFQAVGDYSGAPETFGAQLGIWRTGFEAVTIDYLNLTPDYVSYSTSSGMLTAAETFTTDLGTTGEVITDDGAGTVTVQNLSQALVAGEVITGDTSTNTVTVDTYTNPAFAVGDTITGGTTGATAVIVTDDGAASMTAYMTSAGVAFDGSEVLDNGNGVTADQDGVATGPTIVLGDVVIWNLLHYQLTDAILLDGTDPATNTAAYTLLDKATYPETYVTAWDVSEYDFPNDSVVYRQDLRGGLVRGAIGVMGYQFGRNDCAGNNIQSPDTFDIRNLVASFNNNTTFPGAIVSEIITGADTVIENNILENGAQLTGITAGANCSISRNKSGPGATLGGSTTMGDGAEMNDNDLASAAGFSNLNLSTDTRINNCVLYSDASFFDITIYSGSITKCTLFSSAGFSAITLSSEGGSNATIDSVVLFPSVGIDNVLIESGYTINRCTLEAIEISGKTIATEINENRGAPGFSNFAETIDITGLTTLDCLAENNYVGIFNLTSSNATETISADSLTNFPTLFPFRLAPASGLAVTLTCTAAASATAGSIVGSSGTIVLDGTNGDFVELEADSTGTFVRVKNLQVYA